jgi:hypothetical protein
MVFEFQDKLKLGLSTAHLALTYIDILLSRQLLQERAQKLGSESHHTPTSEKHRRQKLLLKAQLCLMLAAK